MRDAEESSQRPAPPPLFVAGKWSAFGDCGEPPHSSPRQGDSDAEADEHKSCQRVQDLLHAGSLQRVARSGDEDGVEAQPERREEGVHEASPSSPQGAASPAGAKAGRTPV